jgi:hypothetical protein
MPSNAVPWAVGKRKERELVLQASSVISVEPPIWIEIFGPIPEIGMAVKQMNRDA